MARFDCTRKTRMVTENEEIALIGTEVRLFLRLLH